MKVQQPLQPSSSAHSLIGTANTKSAQRAPAAGNTRDFFVTYGHCAKSLALHGANDKFGIGAAQCIYVVGAPIFFVIAVIDDIKSLWARRRQQQPAATPAPAQ